ncbi:MAG: SIMPL domain-containing protein [Candidatus Zixiibacteriota bacterium]|nr:MAG: SIMPL domain-containing protein [candidate division Zixibacteria bacterium]
MAGGRLLFKAVCGAVMLWSSAVMAQYYRDSPKDQPTIAVSGEAEIKVVPDRAVITLGLETLDTSMVAAKKENDRMIEAISKTAKKYGVKDADIQTDYLTVEPKYERRRNEYGKEIDFFLGHNVKRRLVIDLTDVSKFDDLLSSIIETGVSRIIDVGFYTDHLKKYREQARALAIKAAVEKAEKLTAEIGQKVGKAVGIREGSSYWRSFYGGWDSYRRPGQRHVSQVSVDSEFQGDTPVALGKISVTASVSVSFLLE